MLHTLEDPSHTKARRDKILGQMTRRNFFPLSEIMDLRLSSSMCVMLGAEDPHPWSATKGNR